MKKIEMVRKFYQEMTPVIEKTVVDKTLLKAEINSDLGHFLGSFGKEMPEIQSHLANPTHKIFHDLGASFEEAEELVDLAKKYSAAWKKMTDVAMDMRSRIKS